MTWFQGQHGFSYRDILTHQNISNSLAGWRANWLTGQLPDWHHRSVSCSSVMYAIGWQGVIVEYFCYMLHPNIFHHGPFMAWQPCPVICCGTAQEYNTVFPLSVSLQWPACFLMYMFVTSHSLQQMPFITSWPNWGMVMWTHAYNFPLLAQLPVSSRFG